MDNAEVWEDLLSRLAPPHMINRPNIRNVCSFSKHKDFTREELDSVFVKVKKDTAAGSDTITYSMISQLPDNMLDFILKLYNDIIDQKRSIPEEWKIVLIAPIVKVGKDFSLVQNHRPIALMNCIVKIMENLMKQRIEYNLESKNVLPEEVNGFRRGRGTADNLTVLTSDIYRAFLVAVFIALAAAYDNVELEELEYNLIECNVEANLVHVIMQMLRGRKLAIRTRCGSVYGSRYAHRGLLQGSPLSPLLFNIYTKSFKNNLVENTSV